MEEVLCPCNNAPYEINVRKVDSFTECPVEFSLSCPCNKNLSFSEIESGLKHRIFEVLRRRRIRALLEEKSKLLEQGIWPWNRRTRNLHKEVNKKLESLGVYQGKY
ncbi:MAG: hypothetical protein RIC35_22580 [Marinoscillum sp.]